MNKGESEKKRKIIMSRTLTNYLLEEGYMIVEVIGNKQDIKQTVFVFENAEGLDEAMERYGKLSYEEKGKYDKY